MYTNEDSTVGKKYKDKSSTSSSLSLHIENSVEDGYDNLFQRFKLTEDPFMFNRHQKDEKCFQPVINSFKASEKLRSPAAYDYDQQPAEKSSDNIDVIAHNFNDMLKLSDEIEVKRSPDEDSVIDIASSDESLISLRSEIADSEDVQFVMDDNDSNILQDNQINNNSGNNDAIVGANNFQLLDTFDLTNCFKIVHNVDNW
jgi:hypothetical protein